MPAMMLNSVLLPQPLGPMTVTNSPTATVISIEASVSSACRPLRNVFDTPCASNFAVSMLLSSIRPSDKESNEKAATLMRAAALYVWRNAGTLMPLPSAGIIQIRFIGSAARQSRLLLSRVAPLAAKCSSSNRQCADNSKLIIGDRRRFVKGHDYIL